MKGRKTVRTLHKKLIAAITAALLCAALVGCSAADAAASAEASKIAVSVKPIEKGTLETYARNSAKVLASREIMIVPKVSGTVESLHFDIGQKVSKGDVLFVIDDTDISLQAAQAEAGYLAAQANYDKTVGGGASQQLLQLETAVNTAKINLDNAALALNRAQELFNIGAASQQALEAAQSSFALADQQYRTASENLSLTKNHILQENEQAVAAALKQAKAAYDLAQRQLSNTVVTSDIDGIVGIRTISAGSVVGPQSPVMSVIDISKVTVEFGVSDAIVNLIRAGETPVEIEIGALGSKKVMGKVKPRL
jgi:multidrug resistance efflux pump